MEEDRTGSPSICPNTADPDSRWISFVIFVFSLSLFLISIHSFLPSNLSLFHSFSLFQLDHFSIIYHLIVLPPPDWSLTIHAYLISHRHKRHASGVTSLLHTHTHTLSLSLSISFFHSQLTVKIPSSLAIMNRFRRHKKEKAKDDVVQADKASTTTIISAISSRKDNSNNNNNNNNSNNNNNNNNGNINNTTTTTTKKDDELPPKTPDLDLSNALPPPEDFRTSLIMPKLSARFSMLKDQDNPESMMGKASDDSVLFPKRASRLNLFGHNPSLLSDIDEMSMDGSRPSLGVGRSDSYASGSGDGYGTDDDRSQNGSIMSRARRADGNNLFGGRQKVYKIPAKSRGASPNPESRSAGGGGGGGLGRAVYEHDVTLSAFQRMRLKEKEERVAAEQQYSPALESEDALSSIGSTNRTTYCSTASGPPPTTGRASTAATSIDEQPTTPQSLAPSMASNNNEGLAPKPLVPAMAAERGSAKTRRLYGQGLAQSVQNQQNSTLNRLENLSRQRPGTPELPLNRAYSRSATNLRDRLQALNVAAHPPSRPTSPPLSSESPRPQIVENESKDPPPASGLPPLSPPISEVDEQQPQPLAVALQPEDHGKATALGMFNKPRAAPFDENQFTRRQLQMHQGRNTPPLRRPPSPPRAPQEPAGHSRALSNASYRSRANSGSSHYSESQRGMGTTFFANSSASESGDEGDFPESRRASQEMDIHPAFRSQPPSKPSTPEPHENPNPLPEVRFSDLGDLKPIAENEIAEDADAQNDDPAPQEPDSPTLGPSGLGLSGLVRTHLRRDSDKSIHLPSPGLPPKTSDESPPEPQPVAEGASPDSTISAPSADNDNDHDSQVSSEPRTSSSSSDREVRHSTHRRNASTETQREREEFANELAERRRRVQEKLQGFADDSRPGSRAGSPLPGRQTPDTAPKPGNAFALLKNRNGKHNLFQKQSAFGNSSTPSLALDQNDPWREEDERVPFPSLGSNQLNYSSPNVAAERPSVRSRVAAFTRSNSRDGSESSRSRGASPHSMTGFRPRRDRSRSDASIRSKSRRRDDLETVDEGSVISHEMFQLPSTTYDPRANASAESSARPSTATSEASTTYDRCSSVASGRNRSGSRSGTPSYFDLPPPPQNLPPPPPAAMIGTSPRPSPIAPPYSANATPPLYEITPDPTSPPAPTFAAAASHVVPQRAPGHSGLAKRPVNKTLISEPTLVSSTSNVPTIGLPAGASLNNGMQTPPVPPMNPRRRRQTTTQTILGAFKGDKHDSQASSTEHTPSGSGRGTPDERSAFDEFERRPLSRSRLRKISSEGGSLNAKARQEILTAGPPPPLPYPPPQHPPPGIPANMDGGMF